MSVTVSRAYLYDNEQGEMVEAEVWDAITETRLADWEGEWLPELFKAM